MIKKVEQLACRPGAFGKLGFGVELYKFQNLYFSGGLTMNISIPPVAIVLTIIVVSNFLISFGESNVMKKSYILMSSILSAMGILGILTIRPSLTSKLYKNLNNGRFDAEFVSWAIKKFDYFAFISIAVTCLAIIILLCLLYINKKNEDGFVLSSISGFVNILRVINIFVMLWYSYGIINKRFDLASYIFTLSISEIFALYIPLIAKRIIIDKR